MNFFLKATFILAALCSWSSAAYPPPRYLQSSVEPVFVEINQKTTPELQPQLFISPNVFKKVSDRNVQLSQGNSVDEVIKFSIVSESSDTLSDTNCKPETITVNSVHTNTIIDYKTATITSVKEGFVTKTNTFSTTVTTTKKYTVDVKKTKTDIAYTTKTEILNSKVIMPVETVTEKLMEFVLSTSYTPIQYTLTNIYRKHKTSIVEAPTTTNIVKYTDFPITRTITHIPDTVTKTTEANMIIYSTKYKSLPPYTSYVTETTYDTEIKTVETQLPTQTSIHIATESVYTPIYLQSTTVSTVKVTSRVVQRKVLAETDIETVSVTVTNTKTNTVRERTVLRLTSELQYRETVTKYVPGRNTLSENFPALTHISGNTLNSRLIQSVAHSTSTFTITKTVIKHSISTSTRTLDCVSSTALPSGTQGYKYPVPSSGLVLPYL